MKITAPWTIEQTAALNAWQRDGSVHPFTCGSGDRMDARHAAARTLYGGDFGQLMATPSGWFCPACDYRQNWAHDFMANPVFRAGTEEPKAPGVMEASLDIQATRAHVYSLRDQLPMFVIYEEPDGWPPGFFVAVLWTSLPEPERSDLAIGDRSLERLQTTMEALGLHKLMRSEGDDPAILETWL